ncbi:MAG: exodeoxyribonuclease VII small subunit, partial [Lactobacillus iners]|nr:exodeoxyribonuclease VII small subunit [Lactobacillus iners]
MSDQKNTFEEQLKQLQDIVTKLEGGNVPLEDALNQFQEGVKLSRELEQKLNDAEKIVAKLIDKDGNVKQLNPE